MNVSASLQNVRDAFAIISSYPAEKHKPVIIGEDDPDGCAACVTPAYGYRNNLIFPSYTAAAFSRDIDLATRYCINLEGALTWAFEFDDRAYFDGLRVLATNQIDKPILKIFRIFGKLTGQRVNASSSGQASLDDILAHSVRGESDVGILAAYNTTTRTLSAMIWNYHDDDLPKPDAKIELDVRGLDAHWNSCQRTRVTHYRIDNSRSNSYTRWLEMGAPQNPTEEQIAELKAAGQPQMLGKPEYVTVKDGKVEIDFALPIHRTSLLVFEEE